MTTTVTKSIGTSSRDYATLQLWEDAIPADLTAVDQVWVGECYNDSEFTGPLAMASHTSDATRYVKLTAAAGQSFQDNANVRTNPLKYDQSKGVGIDLVGSYTYNITVSSTNYFRLERLQIRRSVTTTYDSGLLIFTSATNGTVKDCIFGHDSGPSHATGAHAAVESLYTNTFINCLVYDKTTSGTPIAFTLGSSAALLNCTIVNGSGSARGRGIELSSATATCNNTAIFGWSLTTNGSTISSGDYNATDAVSLLGGGTHNQLSKTYSAQFESTTADWRIKTGSDLIAHGNTDATLAPKDISNFTRAATTGGSIGAWEFASAAGGTLLKAQNIAVASISKMNQISYASIKAVNTLTTGN